MEQHHAWAESEFGTVQFGHVARQQCLVRVGALMAARPASRVTEFCQTSADRQSAYGFIENSALPAEEITRAAGRAAFERASSTDEFVLVPADGTSVTLTDRAGKKGLGQVGRYHSGRGVQVQTALLLDAKATPLGVLAQEYWVRPDATNKPRPKVDKRATREKETQKWLDLLNECECRAAEFSGLKLWFQLDRGYDSWPILQRMTESPAWYTVRGAYNRALWTEADDDDRYMQDLLAHTPLLGTRSLQVAASRSRAARTATIALRAAKVAVKLTDPSQGQRKWPASLWVVQLEEQGTNPEGEAPIRWTLWTNYDVESLDDAMLVVSNYKARWRVEEFHRVWKSGALRIEESQLRTADNFERLARIAASVAARILRLTYLARTQPELPACREFSDLECRALQLLDPAPAPTPTTERTVAQAVRLLADIGGYTGKSSGGPPGALVLTRGYRELHNSVRVLERFAEKRDQW